MGEERRFFSDGYSFPHLLLEQSNTLSTSDGNYENITTLLIFQTNVCIIDAYKSTPEALMRDFSY